MSVLTLAVSAVGDAGDGEGQLVDVAEDNSGHGVATEQLYRPEWRDTTYTMTKHGSSW